MGRQLTLPRVSLRRSPLPDVVCWARVAAWRLPLAVALATTYALARGAVVLFPQPERKRYDEDPLDAFFERPARGAPAVVTLARVSRAAGRRLRAAGYGWYQHGWSSDDRRPPREWTWKREGATS